MRIKSKRIYVIVLFGVVAIMAGLVAFIPNEPAYRGTYLTGWLKQLRDAPISSPLLDGSHPEAHQAIEAIQTIGTNALPTLLKLVRKRESTLELTLNRMLAKQSILPKQSTPAKELNKLGVLGFRVLGTNAQPAIPELLKDLRGEDTVAREYAWVSLNYIGYEGPR